MASRDLTRNFMEYRATAQRRKRKNAGNNSNNSTNGVASSSGGGGLTAAAASVIRDSGYKKLTAGGGDLLLTEEETSAGGIQLTSLGGGSGSSNNNNNNVKPAWVSHVEAVEHALQEIQHHMDSLQSLHATRLGSVFGKDLSHMEGKIEMLTGQITSQFRTAEQSLQKVGILTRREGGQEAMVGMNIQKSLAKQLQELSVVFRQSQRKYLAEVQAQKSGGLVPSDFSSKFGISVADLENGGGGGGGGGGMAGSSSSSLSGGEFFTSNNQQQSLVVDDMSMMIQSRDQEIAQIAKSIEELGTIFKELAVLVIDQGTILDRIDYNMEAVVESTKTGIKQLEKAEKHQKNARPLRCIICLSITIFILLIILILKHHPRRGWF